MSLFFIKRHHCWLGRFRSLARVIYSSIISPTFISWENKPHRISTSRSSTHSPRISIHRSTQVSSRPPAKTIYRRDQSQHPRRASRVEQSHHGIPAGRTPHQLPSSFAEGTRCPPSAASESQPTTRLTHFWDISVARHDVRSHTLIILSESPRITMCSSTPGSDRALRRAILTLS